MNWFVIISLFVAFVSSAAISPVERRRALEKELLRTLQGCHAGSTEVETMKFYNDFELSTDHEDESESKTDLNKNEKERERINSIEKLPIDTQQLALSFLNINDLLSTRLVSRQFRLISDLASHSKISAYNPKFFLKEAWMNFTMLKFLEYNFSKGNINADEFFYTVEDVITEGAGALKTGKYPVSFAFIAFLYEYQKGIGSSLPMIPSELYPEIIAAVPEIPELKMGKLMLKVAGCHFESNGINDEERERRREFLEETIKFLAIEPDSEALKNFFNFDPRLPLERTRLKELPPFFRVALFNLILPLCEEEERFREAIEMASSAFIFSQVLLDQLEEKFPHLVTEMFDARVTVFPAGQRALKKRFDAEVVGLDYLLSRNTINRFDLQELLQLNPDIPLLMSAFLQCNKMSLTEADMIYQMQEAGLFSEIQDQKLLRNINLVISGEIRSEMISNYSDLISLMISLN